MITHEDYKRLTADLSKYTKLPYGNKPVEFPEPELEDETPISILLDELGIA